MVIHFKDFIRGIPPSRPKLKIQGLAIYHSLCVSTKVINMPIYVSLFTSKGNQLGHSLRV